MSRKWDYDRLMSEMHHRPDVDFSLVAPEDITDGYNSMITITHSCGKLSTDKVKNIFSSKTKRTCSKCSNRKKWTLKKFISAMRERTEIDISLVTEKHIKGKESQVPLLCNICNYKWETTIASVINAKSGCHQCNGTVKWNLERLKAALENRPEIDTSLVTEEHIRSNRSVIPLRCTNCSYEWSPNISNLTRGSQCPQCVGKVPWNLKNFLEAMENEPDIDTSLVTEEHINGNKSHVPLLCKVCNYNWSPSIDKIMHGRNCPNCSGHARWDLKRFKSSMEDRVEIDISLVKEEHINGCNSHIPLLCAICKYSWETSITSVFHGGHGCPQCSKNAKWDLKRFTSAMESRTDIDISLVTEDHINGCNSRIPLICKLCNYNWSPSIGHVVNSGSSCPECYGNIRWNLERFRTAMESRKEIDTSLVTEEHINNSKSHVPLLCKKCNHQWCPVIGSVINSKRGCPSCRSSKGEQAIVNILNEYQIPYTREITFSSLPRKRFDFSFKYNDKDCLLEFDGGQHFFYNSFFHTDEYEFKERQEIDRVKTLHALANGYTLIRIDFTQIDNILDHITRAVNNKSDFYSSSPDMYSYIHSDPNLNCNSHSNDQSTTYTNIYCDGSYKNNKMGFGCFADSNFSNSNSNDNFSNSNSNDNFDDNNNDNFSNSNSNDNFDVNNNDNFIDSTNSEVNFTEYYGQVPPSLLVASKDGNYTAKLYAIYQSLKLFQGDLNIHTNSLLCINVLQNKCRSHSNNKLVQTIKSIISTRNIIFTYVYCHTYIQDQDTSRAYELAKMGRQ